MLELGLVNWAVTEVMKRGFTPLTTPELVRSSVVEKCGFQPRGTNTQVCNSNIIFIVFNLGITTICAFELWWWIKLAVVELAQQFLLYC